MCLRCGKEESSYCEDCMQEVIAENAKLQLEINSLNKVYTKLDKREKEALDYFEGETLSEPMFYGNILTILVEKQLQEINRLRKEVKRLK